MSRLRLRTTGHLGRTEDPKTVRPRAPRSPAAGIPSSSNGRRADQADAGPARWQQNQVIHQRFAATEQRSLADVGAPEGLAADREGALSVRSGPRVMLTPVSARDPSRRRRRTAEPTGSVDEQSARAVVSLSIQCSSPWSRRSRSHCSSSRSHPASGSVPTVHPGQTSTTTKSRRTVPPRRTTTSTTVPVHHHRRRARLRTTTTTGPAPTTTTVARHHDDYGAPDDHHIGPSDDDVDDGSRRRPRRRCSTHDRRRRLPRADGELRYPARVETLSSAIALAKRILHGLAVRIESSSSSSRTPTIDTTSAQGS